MAVSGGPDSTALWHLCARLARADGGLEVVALHVHHGLQPQAQAWVEHLRRQAQRWRTGGLPVSLRWQQLAGSPARGDSVEAWARRGRYAALAAMARNAGAGLILLAHHRRDQAETVLLQALRGGGPAGLAAMPRSIERNGLIWARPWLDQPREAITAYLRRHRLRAVDDPSNADSRWARGALRLQVWPALTAAFADAEQALARTAARAQEAAACLSELAAVDLAHCGGRGAALDLSAWAALSAARRGNCLRHWLLATIGDAPDQLVRRLLDELPGHAAGRWPAPGGELRRYRGELAYVRAHQPPAALQPRPIAAQPLDLSRCGRHRLPGWQGSFVVTRVQRGGLPLAALRSCEARPRAGGEQFQRAAQTPPRSLKKQFQAAAVPAWARDGPLLFDRDGLLFVPGLGIDARRIAAAGELRSLRWVVDSAPGRERTETRAPGLDRGQGRQQAAAQDRRLAPARHPVPADRQASLADRTRAAPPAPRRVVERASAAARPGQTLKRASARR